MAASGPRSTAAGLRAAFLLAVALSWFLCGPAAATTPALTIDTTSLPAGTVNQFYSTSLAAGGGSGGYSWLASGLPPGIALTAGSGTLNGTPLRTGGFSVVLTVYDSTGDRSSTTLTLTVNSALTITPVTLPAATVGTPYSASVSASGGTGAYTWQASGLPPGLTITAAQNTSATISGTPTTYGVFNAVVSVRDSINDTAGFSQYIAVGYASSSGGNTSPFAPEANVGVVGPDGGTVATPDNAVSVDVPAGAFLSRTVLSVAKSAIAYPAPAGFTPASPSWTISAGSPPMKPLTITITYDSAVLGNADPARMGMYVYDQQTAAWHWLTGQPPEGDNTLTVDTLSTGVFAVEVNTTVFQDMDLAPWAQTAVDTLLGADIISGTAPGRFSPMQNVSRAQFAVMLTRLTSLAPAPDGRTPFTDVPSGAWYAPYVAAVYKSNLMAGTGAATFSPEAPVTREEMAVILARLPGVSSEPGDASQFTDAKAIDSWAAAAVDEVVGAGVMTGYPDGSFRPLAPATRAETAVVLYNYLNLVTGQQ